MLYSARQSQVTIFPSQVALLSALDYGPDIKKNSIVNYLAVNPRFRAGGVERQWGENGVLKLIYVSVFYPHKDPLTLAEATKILNLRGLKSQTHITMEPDDFEPWPNCEGELEQLQSMEYSQFLTLGRVEHNELNEVLKRFDIFGLG